MTNTEQELASELAADRLCMALLKLERETPGALEQVRNSMQIPIGLADNLREASLGAVWRRFADMIAAVQSDLEEEASR